MEELRTAAARMVCVGFDGFAVTDDVRRLIDQGVASVILFARNYQSPDQIRDLCRHVKALAKRPVMVCIDQEGGRVQRLGEPFTSIPSMRELGKSNDAGLARRLGETIARELRSVNIDVNLAPVLDVDSNPANPVIGDRSLGSDPALVAAMGCALIMGMQRPRATTWARIAACAKHFPGHGDTSLDSHFDLPRVSHNLRRLQRVELPPFAAAVQARVAAIMCAHILNDELDKDFPATMSHATIAKLLRHQMGYEGVVLSDDLEMRAITDHFGIAQAVARGVEAGIDLFLACHSPAAQQLAIESIIRTAEQSASARANIQEANCRLDRLFGQFVRSAHSLHRA
jgi:beta-N-acetylhexosaminidase